MEYEHSIFLHIKYRIGYFYYFAIQKRSLQLALSPVFASLLYVATSTQSDVEENVRPWDISVNKPRYEYVYAFFRTF